MQVIVGNNIEDSLRRLQRLLIRDGILIEVKRRNEYANPTERRKLKMRIAENRRKRKERKHDEARQRWESFITRRYGKN